MSNLIIEENLRKNPFLQGRRIRPVHWKKDSGIEEIIKNFESTCFEARKLAEAANLFRTMIESGDTIWLGIAGAGIVGGLGGYVIDLIKAGFVDVICSTGAQVYHDAHFSFDLPIFQGDPNIGDNTLKEYGIVRIYDMFTPQETLIEQDEKIREFGRRIETRRRSTADLNYEWGDYINRNSKYPEDSFVAIATKYQVPIFWDSESNHSLAMNIAYLKQKEDIDIAPCPSLSLEEGAAIVYAAKQNGFFELGGGGPKNWIQTLAPMLSQILRIKFEGADRGIQITTASEYDGGLSGCTFREGITWGKYKDANIGIVQLHGEYSVIFPLLVGYVLETCKPRESKRLINKKSEFYQKLLVETSVH